MKNKLPQLRKVAVINYKGGTGKSTTAVNLAFGLARAGKRVLMIDADAQGAATYSMGQNPASGLYDLLMGKKEWSKCLVSVRENLDLIPVNEHLFVAELAMTEMNRREHVLSQRLKNVSDYDFIVFDCSPSMTMLNQNILLYVDEVLIPLSMEYLSMIGIKALVKNMKLLTKLFQHSISTVRVLPTFFDARKKHSLELLDNLKRVFPRQVLGEIRVSNDLARAPGLHQSIFEYRPKCAGAQDYGNLVKEVLGYG